MTETAWRKYDDDRAAVPRDTKVCVYDPDDDHLFFASLDCGMWDDFHGRQTYAGGTWWRIIDLPPGVRSP